MKEEKELNEEEVIQELKFLYSEMPFEIIRKASELINKQCESINILSERYTDLLDRTLEEPESIPVLQPLTVGSHLMGKCPQCKTVLSVMDCPNFCGHCGQAVKWMPK